MRCEKHNAVMFDTDSCPYCKIDELEAENELLKLNYDHYESFDEGLKAGMKRFAEIADEYSGVHYKIDELINRIRAEIEGKE